eukprot:CAMPEP_0184862268 /NCGR_PEP_ID=MMETSP0580-20130426/6752_1 /TAXON_ID=1118495 /ORGANISM="Dactyliosolen fragilissimus" /LENGTH=482 /DNA_ID=CAMNT_0027360043 /DNA_START=198 /DNA_END=1646 /DNA_ORIENTATION=+
MRLKDDERNSQDDESSNNDDDDNDNNNNNSMKCMKNIFGYIPSKSVRRASSSFDSWKTWTKVSATYYAITPKSNTERVNATYFLRASSFWTKIEQWCLDPNISGEHGMEILSSLQNGVTYDQSRFRKIPLGTFKKGKAALEAIFAFSDGQSILGNSARSIFRGILGGYGAYNIITCTTLLDTHTCSKITNIPEQLNDAFVPLAVSMGSNSSQKKFYVQCSTGCILLDAAREIGRHASPQTSSSSTSTTTTSTTTTTTTTTPTDQCCHESALLWFEELANRLTNRQFHVDVIYQKEVAIVQYPSLPSPGYAGGGTIRGKVPITSRAVTRGVEVVASSVLAIEQMQSPFIYSIRIRLLVQGEQGYLPPSERGFDTCQLFSRHWRIRNHDDDSVDRVDGDGVIGMYPLLHEGGYVDHSMEEFGHIVKGDSQKGTFEYRSCCGDVQGSMQGHFTFVPGSLEHPSQGRPFDVLVAPFALERSPLFIF